MLAQVPGLLLFKGEEGVEKKGSRDYSIMEHSVTPGSRDGQKSPEQLQHCNGLLGELDL